MILYIIGLASSEGPQSFLQQSSSSSGADPTQADYDLFTYYQLDNQSPSLVDQDLYPQGSSTPDNDYLLQQYKDLIDYYYQKYYLDETNSSSPSNSTANSGF